MRLKRPQREDEIIPIEVVDIDELASRLVSSLYQIFRIVEAREMFDHEYFAMDDMAELFLMNKEFLSPDLDSLQDEFYEFFIRNV